MPIIQYPLQLELGAFYFFIFCSSHHHSVCVFVFPRTTCRFSTHTHTHNPDIKVVNSPKSVKKNAGVYNFSRLRKILWKMVAKKIDEIKLKIIKY